MNPDADGNRKRAKNISIKTYEEPLDCKKQVNNKETAIAKIMQQNDGYWIYHKNKVDLQSMFSQPEEKLWMVVKDYNGILDKGRQNDSAEERKGIRLEKNSVIKMGRVRLRVRDIDYADQRPINLNLQMGTANSASPQKSAREQKSNTQRKGGDGASDGALELNDIQLLEEAQRIAQSVGVGRAHKDDIKSVKSDKKKITKVIEADGKKIVVTDEDVKEGRASKTKITEQSEEPVCRICLCTEEEVPDGGDDGKEPNPLISPCKCAGTMGMIHFKCLKDWLETKRTKRVHKGQTTIKFNKLDCELCKT